MNQRKNWNCDYYFVHSSKLGRDESGISDGSQLEYY